MFMPCLTDNGALHISTAIASYVLSLGPDVWFGPNYYGKGPFALPALACPPFDAIRATPRFWILFLLSFYILMGFGIVRIESLFANRSHFKILAAFRSAIIAFALVAVLPTHFHPVSEVPTRAEMPPHYVWLSQMREAGVILEVPATSLFPRVVPQLLILQFKSDLKLPWSHALDLFGFCFRNPPPKMTAPVPTNTL